jgi:hypothetical protein
MRIYPIIPGLSIYFYVVIFHLILFYFSLVVIVNIPVSSFRQPRYRALKSSFFCSYFTS